MTSPLLNNKGGLVNPSLTYTVIGAGEVGPAIVWWLLQHRDTVHVVLADVQGDRAEAALRRIASPFDITRNRCSSAFVDLSAADDSALVALFRRSQVVISAVPASYSPTLAAVAIQTGTHFCDLGGVTSVSRELRQEFSEPAKRAGVRIVHDCGLMPGLGNMQARVLWQHLGGADEIVIYVGGLPQQPQASSFNWQRTFSAQGLLELLGPAPVVHNGQVVQAEPCSSGTTLEVPLLGRRTGTRFGDRVRTRITAGAGLAPWTMRALGVREYREETIRWEWDAFLAFIGDIPSEYRAKTIEEVLPHTGRDWPDLVVMRVVAEKEIEGVMYSARYDMMDFYDTRMNMSAMARTTGFSAAVVAQEMAQRNRIPAGVVAPEELDGYLNDELIRTLSSDLDISFSSSM